MCTATWAHTSIGYDLFFNRDEKHSRRKAHGPELFRVDGVQCLAPADAEFGGTWIGVNQFGLSFALLNGSAALRQQSRMVSRGLLLRSLLSSATQSDFTARLASTTLRNYDAFTALLIDVNHSASSAAWDGTRLWISSNANAALPFTSSSYQTEEVCRRRRDLYAQSRHKSLRDFHTSHNGVAGPDSVCMHRDDAQTVSHTHIAVSDREATLSYIDGPPCAGSAPVVLRLPLRNNS